MDQAIEKDLHKAIGDVLTRADEPALERILHSELLKETREGLKAQGIAPSEDIHAETMIVEASEKDGRVTGQAHVRWDGGDIQGETLLDVKGSRGADGIRLDEIHSATPHYDGNSPVLSRTGNSEVRSFSVGEQGALLERRSTGAKGPSRLHDSVTPMLPVRDGTGR